MNEPTNADVPGESLQHGTAHTSRAMEPTHDPSHGTDVVRRYYTVFGSLIALTLLTVGAAEIHFPANLAFLHTPVAFAIAGVKASLVILFFMHLWDSPRLIWLIAFGSLLWLAILFVLTFADYWTRGEVFRTLQ